MKTNLIEKVKRMSTEYRFGDFFRNFIAVVLGIVITFAGSDLIEERKIRNEVKDALSLVKDEILLNRETIEELMEQELFEQRGACYLLQYKDSIDKASPDSIEKYGYSPFQSFNPIYIDDAIQGLLTVALKGEKGQSYNISTNREAENFAAIDEMAEIIVKVVNEIKNTNINLLYEKESNNNNRSSGIVLCNDKLSALGWKVNTSLEDGIRKTVENFIDDLEKSY